MSANSVKSKSSLVTLFLRRSRSAFLLTILAGIVSGASTTALIAIINSWIKNGGGDTTLTWAFAGLCIVRMLAGVGCHILLIRLSQGAIYDLRAVLCETILKSPLRELELAGNARLTAAFTEDMVSIANVVINLPYMFVNGIIVCGCLVYLGWLSAAMLCGILACLFLGALSYLLPVLWANRRLQVARKMQNQLFGHFRGLTEGIKELKLHTQRRVNFLSQVLLPSADEVRKQNVTGITIYSVAANWSRMLFFIYVGLMLFFAPALMPREGATLAGYILVILYMMAPLEAIMNTLPHLAHANVALQHVDELESSLRDAGNERCAEKLSTNLSKIHLHLEEVGYVYSGEINDRHFALGPLNLSLHSGEVLFLVGGNGSGKTTLAKLVCGLYEPGSGRISLNGEPVDASRRESFRQLFSVVFSDFFLFDALLGLDPAGLDDRAREYLKLLQLDHKLTIVNGVFSTTALSQGQRKRLALLVALLECKPICIFDEWAADQEPRFRHVFYDRILPDLKAQGRAILVITHDDRFFDRADRLIKLEEGALIEEPPFRTPFDVTLSSEAHRKHRAEQAGVTG